MVRTKANYVPRAYRKALASQAPRKVPGSSTFVTNSSSSSRKAENKHAGGNPVCVCPTPKWQQGIREFFRLSLKVLKKRTRYLKEQEAVAEEKQREKLVLCNLITEMMKTNRIYSSE
uniref:PCNA-associated factor n=1 Tax=Mus spicilegus TaxID=10103 RepID=A0A8C6IHA6_MUSSI